MKQIMVFPRGQLSAKDRVAIAKAGIVAVEADDPSKVVSVIPGVLVINGDDVISSALQAMAETSDSHVRSLFVKYLHAKINGRRATQ